MRCLECSSFFVSKRGDLKVSDPIVGDFIVPDVEYELCEGCGEELYSPATLEAIENAEENLKNELLFKKPLQDFITATEAAKILNISRQAIHKHRRIRRGFIHFVKYMGKSLYHKKSVELYKETGDGRFSLAPQKMKETISDKQVWGAYTSAQIDQSINFDYTEKASLPDSTMDMENISTAKILQKGYIK
jgi:predicted DNA-binding protein YlxM (UPF0122 family)